MALGRRYWWLVIVVLVAVIDIAGRFVLTFDMARVTAFESVLFVGTSLVLAVISTKYRHASLLLARVERGLAVVFGLAGVRASLWAAGVGVAVANLVTLVIGVALAIGLVLRKRYLAQRRTG
jgi:hypothetical protein